MAQNLSGKTADEERFNSSYQIVWVVELDADDPYNGVTTQYYANRKITISGNVYQDYLADKGIDLPWHKLRPWGGIPAQTRAKIKFRNEGAFSDILETYALDNDAVRIGVVFLDGTETSSDIVWIWRGVVEDYPYDLRAFTLLCKDNVDKQFVDFPQKTMTPVDYPDADTDLWGRVVPTVWGDLSDWPTWDDTVTVQRLAKAFAIEQIQQKFLIGNHMIQTPEYYVQIYDAANRAAYIDNAFVTVDTDTGEFQIDDSEREIYLFPGLPMLTNDVSTWGKVAKLTESVELVNGNNLDVQFGGIPKLGTVKNPGVLYPRIQIEITAGSTASTFTLKENGVAHSTLNGYSSSTTINMLLDGDYSNDWNFETITLEVDGPATGTTTIEYVRIWMKYDDQLSAEFRPFEVAAAVQGWKDDASQYNNGSSISSDIYLRTPVDMLEAFFRGKILMNKPLLDLDFASFDTARTIRNWPCAFQITERKGIDWLDRYCREFGIHLYYSVEENFRVIAITKDPTPTHTFLWQHDIAVVNPTAKVSEFNIDCKLGRTPTTQIINDIVVRHGVDYSTDRTGAVSSKSAHYRLTGTGASFVSTGAATGRLTDAGADFVNDGALAGDTLYIAGYKDFDIDTVGATTLDVTDPDGGPVFDKTNVEYWEGPSVDGACIRSQERYKTVNSLGEAVTMRTEGGFRSDFLIDADNMVEWVRDFRAERSMVADFASHSLVPCDVELGDICFFDHPLLPDVYRPIDVTAIDANVANSSILTWVTCNQTNLVEVGDYLLCDREIWKVQSRDIPGARFRVYRGQANTAPAAHSSGTTFARWNHMRWMILDYKFDTNKAQVRMRIRSLPTDYKIRGKVSNYATTYHAATADQQLQDGWSSPSNGLLVERDFLSGVSHVSANTNTY